MVACEQCGVRQQSITKTPLRAFFAAYRSAATTPLTCNKLAIRLTRFYCSKLYRKCKLFTEFGVGKLDDIFYMRLNNLR